MKSLNTQYVPAIDHLRAYAALLVIAYHGLQLFWHQATFGAPFTPEHWLSTNNPLLAVIVEGHTAVAFFMVLSGYIFTWGAGAKEVQYRGFIVNRLLRTYPLFILLLMVGIAAQPASISWNALLTTVFGFANMPGAVVVSPFSSMFWAIAIEWHFYLIFPFLLLFMHKYGPRYLLGLIVLLLIYRGLAYNLSGQIRELSYFTIIGRLDQFLLGMLAAHIQLRSPATKHGRALFLLSVVLVVTMLACFHKLGGWPLESAFKVLWPSIEGAVWALFILGYLRFAAYIPGWLSRPIAAIGTVSYSMYLTHFVIIYLMASKGWFLNYGFGPIADALLNTVLLVVPVVLLLSALSYQLVEKPFLNLRVKYFKS